MCDGAAELVAKMVEDELDGSAMEAEDVESDAVDDSCDEEEENELPLLLLSPSQSTTTLKVLSRACPVHRPVSPCHGASHSSWHTPSVAVQYKHPTLTHQTVRLYPAAGAVRQ